MSVLGDLARQSTKKESRKQQRGRLKTFFKGVWSELKKVHWPSKKQLATYTGVVLVAVLALSLAISLFDWIISSIVELLLGLV